MPDQYSFPAEIAAWLPDVPLGRPLFPPLFCFAHAGGSADIYRQWQKALSGSATIYPMELPGRGRRMAEPFCPSVALAARRAAQCVAACVPDSRYFIFGHSLGSIIALETVREIESLGIPTPVLLFVSGRYPPHVMQNHKQALFRAPTPSLLDELRRLGGTPEDILQNRDFLDVLLPVVRDDFRLVETHTSAASPPVSCPICVCCGDRDQDSPLPLLEEWAKLTTGGCTIHLFPGEHFYLYDTKNDMPDFLARRIMGTAAQDLTLR